MTYGLTTILPSPWDKTIGEVYTTASLAQVLGVEETKIAEWQAKGRLLSLESADEHLVFPVFQFNQELKVTPGLLKIWRVLHKAEVSEWSMAVWLKALLSKTAQKSTIDYLEQKGSLNRTLIEAEDAVKNWMS